MLADVISVAMTTSFSRSDVIMTQGDVDVVAWRLRRMTASTTSRHSTMSFKLFLTRRLMLYRVNERYVTDRQTDRQLSQKRTFPLVKCIRRCVDGPRFWTSFDVNRSTFEEKYAWKTISTFSLHVTLTFDL